MSRTFSTAIPGKNSSRFLFALIAAGLAGNYFPFPIFFNAEFLFSSIFSMLALQYFGVGRALVVALISSSYLFFSWGHPYAIIIMTGEVALVSWISHHKIGLVQADAIYWLFIGIPLVFLFYHVFLTVPLITAQFIMAKDMVNGITNVLIARLLFTGYALWQRSTLISYREIIYNLLAAFVLLPALIMLALGSRSDLTEIDQRIRTSVNQDSHRMILHLNTWNWTIHNNSAERQLIQEQPVGPFHTQLYDSYTKKMTVLLLVLLVALALAELVSRKIVARLSQLRKITHELPIRLAHDDHDIIWPESAITEISHLVNNFKEMANSLSQQLTATNVINESLEKRVEERTEELRLATAAAEASNIAKGRFLATMSHEIRTPINGVIGMAQLLVMTDLTEEQRTYVDALTLSGKNLVQLLSDILDLSKIEAHKIELDIRDFDLQTEITGAINILELGAREKSLQLNALIDPDVPLQLRGDAVRLRQIITNLVGNAIKFTPKGSVSLHICVDSEEAQLTTLRFLVRDSGIGIAADKQQQIFEPFTQADASTSRTYGGTGLGLAISSQLAELMGGSIGVESSEGEGSTFWFTAVFEKECDAVHKISPPHSSSTRFAPAHSSTTSRILLAEDEPTNQLVVKTILEKFGYQVDVANNGDETLWLLENNDFALVLMDCMMPVINGYEATAIIRDRTSHVRNHTIPVIALTANAMREDRDTCRAAGMDDYLAKPLDFGELLTLLESWLPPVTRTAPLLSPELSKAFDSQHGEADCGLVPVRQTDFNMRKFVERNLGNSELSRAVAILFCDTVPEYLSAIQTAATAQDAGALLRAAHKLKGAASNLELSSLSEAAAVIESLARSGNLENSATLIHDLEQRLAQAVTALHELTGTELDRGKKRHEYSDR